jgi:phage shock protein C
MIHLILIRRDFMSNTRPPLRRSRRNRVIAGVCGGLAEFFGISAFWFRLAFLIALLPGGVPGIVAYVLFWLIVPKAGE